MRPWAYDERRCSVAVFIYMRVMLARAGNPVTPAEVADQAAYMRERDAATKQMLRLEAWMGF